MKKINSFNKEEIWKEIQGYEGIYEVSNIGRVRSYHTQSRYVDFKPPEDGKPRILKPYINADGQMKVSLFKDSIRVIKSVAKLVAVAFLKQPEDKSWVITVRDGNRLNTVADNLQYCSKSAAMRHAGKKFVRGSRYGGCLNREKAEQIRKKYGTSEGINGDKRKRTVTHESLADEYKVTPAAICQIINKTTYK